MSEIHIGNKSYFSNNSDENIQKLIKNKMMQGYNWLFQGNDGQITWMQAMHYYANETANIKDKIIDLSENKDKAIEAIKLAITKGFEII